MKAPLTHRVSTGIAGEGLRFAAVGLAATGTQIALYGFLDDSVGPPLANVPHRAARTGIGVDHAVVMAPA